MAAARTSRSRSPRRERHAACQGAALEDSPGVAKKEELPNEATHSSTAVTGMGTAQHRSADEILQQLLEEKRAKPKEWTAPDIDEIVHFDWKEGMVLDSKYELQRLLGDGAFGRVVLARDRCQNCSVAVKIIRDVKKYRDSAKVEVALLQDVNKADTHSRSNCVRFLGTFMHDDRYLCMVFEPLGASLFDFLKSNGYRGFWLQDIQSFARQSLLALEFLHERLGLTHTDLKPENILLQSADEARMSQFPRSSFQSSYARKGQPYYRPANSKIKLIDFGNGTYKSMHHASVISTRQYRAPEVVLSLGWDERADIWSLGCILMELYTGNLLFNTNDSLEHLAMMQSIIGNFPQHMLAEAGQVAKKKYVTTWDPEGEEWHRLNWPEGAHSDESVRHVNSQWRVEQLMPIEHEDFADFLSELLTLDPASRPDAKTALQHVFCSMELMD